MYRPPRSPDSISGGSNPYNVTKYGVVALSEGLRLELAPRGIGVSVLCPGFIRTQIMNSRRNLPERFGPSVDAASVPAPFLKGTSRSFANAFRRASIPITSANSFARASRTTGLISSPISSSSPSSKPASPRSNEASTVFVAVILAVEPAKSLFQRIWIGRDHRPCPTDLSLVAARLSPLPHPPPNTPFAARSVSAA